MNSKGKKTNKNRDISFEEEVLSSGVLPPEEASRLSDSIEKYEKQTLDLLLNSFTIVTGFNQGVERFLDILDNSLGIKDVSVETEKNRETTKQFLDCHVYIGFLKLILKDNEIGLKSLDSIEIQVLTSLLRKSLNIDDSNQPSFEKESLKDIQEVGNNLQGLIATFLRDFNKEIMHSSRNTKENFSSFLKELKSTLAYDR